MDKYRHSRAYHKYFENYAEQQILDDSGRMVTQRVYVGNYYAVDLPQGALKRQRALIALFYLLSAAFYLGGGFSAQVSAFWLVALFTAAPLVALIWLAIAVFHRLTAPKEMEVRSWRESAEVLRRVSLGAAICLFSCAVSTLAAAIALDNYSIAETIPSGVLYILSGGFALGIHIVERHTKYKTLPPKHQRSEGSSPIRYYAPD